MEVTQTIKLTEEEREAIAKVIGLCDEISELKSNISIMDVFDYLMSNAEIIGTYKYTAPEILQIAEIG